MSDHNAADNYVDDDEFKLETGTKDDYDGVVVDEWFGTRDTTGNTLYLYLKIQPSDGSGVEERRYSCGDDWASYDGGKTAEHPTKKHFNNNSNIGRLVSATMNLCEQELRTRSKELGGLGPRAAGLLHGFNFHWEVFPDSFQPRGQDAAGNPLPPQEFVRVLPTKFNGVEGVSNPTADTAAATATASGTTESTGDGPLSTVDASTSAQIKVLAKSKPYPEWVDAVMALTGVVENATLMVALGDEAFYNQLKEG